MKAADDWDDEYVPCSWCGGEGFSDCDDPIQCLDPACNGELCTCRGCNGLGHSQVVW